MGWLYYFHIQQIELHYMRKEKNLAIYRIGASKPEDGANLTEYEIKKDPKISKFRTSLQEKMKRVSVETVIINTKSIARSKKLILN